MTKINELECETDDHETGCETDDHETGCENGVHETECKNGVHETGCENGVSYLSHHTSSQSGAQNLRKVPIRSHELRVLRQFEDLDESDTSWECTMRDEEVQAYRSLVHSNPVILLKAYADLQKIPVETAMHFISNAEARAKWDTTFTSFRVVDTCEGCDVMYWRMPAPWPVTDRDFLNWQRVEWNAKTRVCELMARAAEHHDCPEVPDAVRAETILCGYVIRPMDDDPLESSRLFLVVQTDVKGNIPKMLVSMTAQSSIWRWVQELKATCRQARSTEVASQQK